MGKNEFDRAVSTLKRVMDKFSVWGLTAGIIYTTQEGFLKFYGSEAVGDVLDRHQGEILEHPSFSHKQTDDDEGPDFVPEAAGRMNRLLLPSLPKPLDKMAYNDLRDLSVAVVRLEHGGFKR